MSKVPTIESLADKKESDWYFGIGVLTGIVTFLGVWVYAITKWGFLIGITLGWIPAAISAVLAGFLWPLAGLVIGWIMLTSL